MAYRVIQWATGNVGRLAIEGVEAHPDLELVGVWVHSPEKAGQSFGGVEATNSVDEVLALDADCVIYTPMLGQPEEVARILRWQKNVVTPVGWFYPKNTTGIAELEGACREGGVTLHGTGIHPGGITERFPLALSALCTNIRHVKAEEFSDIRNYQAEGVVRDIMLFGKPPAEAAKSPMLDILGSGFSQSVRMVGDALAADPAVAGRLPGVAPRGRRRRSRPHPGPAGNRQPLRELDPVRVRRRAGRQDLPRPADDRGPGDRLVRRRWELLGRRRSL